MMKILIRIIRNLQAINKMNNLSDVEEYLDVYDASGNKVGKKILRGEKLARGEYCLVVHVWIKNENDEILIQKRADNKEMYPGIWATVGGSVSAGEESVEGAVREVAEETGLVLPYSNIERILRLKRRGSFVDVWKSQVLKSEVDLFSYNDEVSEVKWVSKEELLNMVESGDFYDYGNEQFSMVI